MSMTCFSNAAGGNLNKKRSWPLPAETSAAPRVLTSRAVTWSTLILTLWSWPHCFAKTPSNHLSKPGTKWLHCRIFRLFCCARARSGNTKKGPAAVPTTPVAAIWTKYLRVICRAVFFAVGILPTTHRPVVTAEPESFGRARGSVAVGLSWRFFVARRLAAMNGHRLIRLLVDVELKDIRPGIVAHNIQVVLASDDLGAIDLGDQNSFAVRVGSGKKIAEGIDNTTATAANERIRIFSKGRMILSRKVAPTVELVARKHEAPPLDGDVPHRSDPRVARVCGRGAINLNALCVHRRAHYGQIIL